MSRLEVSLFSHSFFILGIARAPVDSCFATSDDLSTKVLLSLTLFSSPSMGLIGACEKSSFDFAALTPSYELLPGLEADPLDAEIDFLFFFFLVFLLGLLLRPPAL